LKGLYSINNLSCNYSHIFFENVRQVIISDKNVITFDTCEVDEDCEGRSPFYHFYLKNIEVKGDLISSFNNLWDPTHFVFKILGPKSFSLRIFIQEKNINREVICKGDAVLNDH
jgi:hypothetical protein